MEDKPKFAFVGNSYMAFWALNVYFPQWECLNYGAPGEGLAYVESFHEDTSDCQVVIQFGSNDIYQLNEENTDDYVERYVKAVLGPAPFLRAPPESSSSHLWIPRPAGFAGSERGSD